MKKGFTLIELLVVVLIIGILSAVALPQYQKAVDRAKGSEALIAAKAVAEAENVYYMANGNYAYPDNSGNLDIEVPDLKNWDIGTWGNTCECGSHTGCHGTFCAFFLQGDIGCETGDPVAKVTLMQYLENGQEVCRCCSGEKCQNYFGVKDGEEF